MTRSQELVIRAVEVALRSGIEAEGGSPLQRAAGLYPWLGDHLRGLTLEERGAIGVIVGRILALLEDVGKTDKKRECESCKRRRRT